MTSRLPLLVMILALGLALLGRSHGTLGEPLWLDEAYSAYAADRSLAFLWQVVPAYETHPPFYYTLLHFWQLAFGDSLLARRALGIACGTATVALIGLCGHRLAGLAGRGGAGRRWLAAAAMLVAAAHPTLTEMSREVRPYGPLMLAYAGGIAALLRLAQDRAAGRPLGCGRLIGFFVAEALVCWLHNLGPLYALTLSLALLLLVWPRERHEWIAVAAGHGAVGLVYLPGLLILVDQAPTWIASTWLRFSWARLPLQLRQLYGVAGPMERYTFLVGALAAGLLVAGGLATVWHRPPVRRAAMTLLLLALLPTTLAILLSITVTPVFIIRTFSAVCVAATLLMVLPLLASGRWRIAAAGLIAFLLVSMAWHVVAMRQGRPLQDWHRVARWLSERHRPGDVIWAYPNEGALPFAYAARHLGLHLPVRPIPAPVPALGVGGFHPTGSRGVVSLYPDQIATLAGSEEARTAPTLWLLRMGPKAYDKEDGLYRALLPGRRVVARATSGPMDLVGLRRLTAIAPPGAQ